MEHFIYFKRLCLMLICCLSVSLTSWADDYTKDNIIYSLNEASSTATVKAVTDKSVTSAKIRSRVAGCNVTKIGTNAFKDCTALTTVTIPTSVTSIEASAFEQCSALDEVSDLSSVTSIGASAFEGCSALTGVSDLSKATNIGASAFKNCSSLKTIDISSVTGYYGLGQSAFEGCCSLVNIKMPSSGWYYLQPCTFKNCTSLTAIDTKEAYYIQSEAFAGCISLQAIEIKNEYVTISSDAFNGCNAIEAFNIPSNSNYHSSKGSVIFNKDKTKLVCAVGKLGNYAIPSTVTSIDNKAFKDCIYLTGVSIPYGVTNIGNNTFEGCTALKSVTIPSTVTTISNEAFKGCSALPSVVIPNSVTSIGTSAFEGNISLKSVLLKPKAISMSDKVFPETTKVICVPVNEDNTKANTINITLNTYGPPSTVESYLGGIWYFSNDVSNIAVKNYNNYDRLDWFNYSSINSDITDILSTNDAAKTFIANRKTIYERLSSELSTPLENVLNETNNVDDFFDLEDSELSVLKAKLNTAYNNVRYAVYEQLDLNDDLYDLYQQGKEVEDKILSNFSTLESIANAPYAYHDGLITDVSQLSTNAEEPTEGSLEGLIDADKRTYFHSRWTGTDYTDGYHFLEIDLKNSYKNIVLKYSKRQGTSSGEGDPQIIHIYADNSIGDQYQEDIDYWTDLGTITCTYDYDNNQTGVIALNLGNSYNHIRLVVEQTKGNRKFFYWSELHVYNLLDHVVPSTFQQNFNNTLEQAKSELDNEYATEETIEKLQELIDKFNDAPLIDFAKSEYLTLYSDKALIVPEGLKAAVVLSDGDNVLSDYRYKAGTVIPAHTGVLLKSIKGNSFYMIEGNTDETAPEDNLLHGTLNDEMTDVEGAGKYYKLSYDRDTKSIIGFYWGATDGGAFLNKAGKAFLALPATMNAQQLKGFALIDLDNGRGNVTGINNATNASDNAFHAYDLNGRRVDAKSLEELQQGVYIVNGKKIIK